MRARKHPSGPFALAESEDEGLDARVQETDVEGVLADRTRLANELVELGLRDGAVAIRVRDVSATGGAGKERCQGHSPIRCDTKRGACGAPVQAHLAFRQACRAPFCKDPERGILRPFGVRPALVPITLPSRNRDDRLTATIDFVFVCIACPVRYVCSQRYRQVATDQIHRSP